MNWNTLNHIESLKEIDITSETQPIVIFKHSTRCPVSSMAKRKFESEWKYEENEIKPYFLDLIQHRDISNEIANRYGVDHESPQILVIKNGVCTFHSSHGEISANQLID